MLSWEAKVQGSINADGLVTQAEVSGSITIGMAEQTVQVGFRDEKNQHYVIIASTRAAPLNSVLKRSAKGTLRRGKMDLGKVNLEIDLASVKEFLRSVFPV